MGGMISTDLIRGHTDTIILNILRQGDSYGYEIYKKIIELSGNRCGPHCIDIAQSIGSCNLTKPVGVIHNRCKKIHCLHNGKIRTQAKNPRIIWNTTAD
jgi:hypothetical protein